MNNWWERQYISTAINKINKCIVTWGATELPPVHYAFKHTDVTKLSWLQHGSHPRGNLSPKCYSWNCLPLRKEENMSLCFSLLHCGVCALQILCKPAQAIPNWPSVETTSHNGANMWIKVLAKALEEEVSRAEESKQPPLPSPSNSLASQVFFFFQLECTHSLNISILG